MPARKLHPGIDQTGGVPYVIRHTMDGREIKILVPQNIDQARIASTIAQSGDVPVEDRLMDLYAKLWPKIGALLTTNAGFSAPLLCRETGAYQDAQVRLIVVGQQTRSWLPKAQWSEEQFSSKAKVLETIINLMEAYDKYLVTDREKGRGFFRAARQIQRAIDPGSGDNIAFLWRNLFICDQNGREPAEEYHEKLRELSPLATELKILRPHVVVFMTGQRFDFTLKSALGQDAIAPCSPKIDARHLAKVAIPGSSAIGLRIPHPRNPRQAIWVKEAIKLIQRELPARFDR